MGPSNDNLRNSSVQISLDEVIATFELQKRKSKPANYEAEAQGFRELGECLALATDDILQKLTDVALRLCQAHSAGISLVDPDGQNFRWRAISGQLKRFLGGKLPRSFSPCGEVLDQKKPLLMQAPERFYPYITELGVAIEEVLLMPFSQNGKLIGTVWIAFHSKNHQFDLEDLRILNSLSHFASAAVQSSFRRDSAEAARAHFRELVDNSPAILWITNTHGRCTYLSRQWYEVTGRTAAQDLGFGWIENVHPEDRESTKQVFIRANEEGGKVSIRYRLRQRDGEYRWVLDSGLPRINPEGEFLGYIGTVVDIHDQVESQLELKRAKDEAEKANSLKSAFLANMSHEIRTPLSAMIGYADLLRDPKLSAEDRESFIEILTRNGKGLAMIINDILDLSKVEAGHLHLDIAETNPHKIAAEVVSLLRVKAQNLQLDLQSGVSTPARITTDSFRLKQILLNLIGNAIKFSPEGSVHVRSFGRKTESGQSLVCFEIKDTGIGIPQNNLESIFEMFVQADSSTARRFGGTGLGLSLSRRLARALGGDIRVLSSVEGQGTTFLLEILDQSSGAQKPAPALRWDYSLESKFLR
ncbi:MAG: ATP-binding protein [Pseudobdellovibrionaceae bacterium]